MQRLEDRASLNRKRSRAPESESDAEASERTDSGCHDGTTNRSPRATLHETSPTVTVPLPSKTWNTEDPASRRAAVWLPLRTRCISARMVGSTSPPVVGLVSRTAACPGSTVPAKPSVSSSSWSVSAASVSTQR